MTELLGIVYEMRIAHRAILDMFEGSDPDAQLFALHYALVHSSDDELQRQITHAFFAKSPLAISCKSRCFALSCSECFQRRWFANSSLR